MSRETASSRIAWVDGPNAVRSARRMNDSSSLGPVEVGVRLDQVVHETHSEAGGREAHLLVGVPEDDVVVALLALDASGLAATDVVSDDLLQGQGGVLGDVAEPSALIQPLDEPATLAP